MFYMMDFEELNWVMEYDEVFDYEGFQIICDWKSLLYFYGLMLDYSNVFIGGGFQFINFNVN